MVKVKFYKTIEANNNVFVWVLGIYQKKSNKNRSYRNENIKVIT